MESFPKIIKIDSLFCGKWLAFKKIYCMLESGKEISQDFVDRPPGLHKKSPTICNGIDIIALIKYKTSLIKKIVIEAIFRPPVKAYVLEFPAGMCELDGYAEDGKRELKEETGYLPEKLISLTKEGKPLISYSDSYLSAESESLIVFEVNGDTPENQVPQQELEEEESIRVFLLDFNDTLLDQLIGIADKNKFLIRTSLYSFALGLKKNFC